MINLVKSCLKTDGTNIVFCTVPRSIWKGVKVPQLIDIRLSKSRYQSSGKNFNFVIKTDFLGDYSKIVQSFTQTIYLILPFKNWCYENGSSDQKLMKDWALLKNHVGRVKFLHRHSKILNRLGKSYTLVRRLFVNIQMSSRGVMVVYQEPFKGKKDERLALHLL